MREVITDDSGTKMFRPNRIVCLLKETGQFDLNMLWRLYESGLFTEEEMREFYQLIGYSVSGYYEIFRRCYEASPKSVKQEGK